MENREDKLISYPGRMEAEAYVYTAGILAEKFFLGLKEEGRIRAAYCKNCDKAFLPVRAFCIFCGKEVRELKDIDQEAYVESFTVARIGSNEEELKEPITVAYLRFEGVEGGLIHRVKGQVKIGMRVKPVFKEKNKRRGDLNDIEYFQ